MGGATTLSPVVSKAYCSYSQRTLLVRRRPRSVGGGGFVVLSEGDQNNVAFAVDGCCALGVSGECVVRDADGNSILVIRKKGGVLQAISFGSSQWRGYLTEFGTSSKVVFTLQEQRSWLAMSGSSRIFLEPKVRSGRWDFDVKGSFADRNCAIRDRRGNVVAEIKEKDQMTAASNKEYFYHVVVQPGHDQAFVVAVIAILDYINGESLRC